MYTDKDIEEKFKEAKTMQDVVRIANELKTDGASTMSVNLYATRARKGVLSHLSTESDYTKATVIPIPQVPNDGHKYAKMIVKPENLQSGCVEIGKDMVVTI